MPEVTITAAGWRVIKLLVGSEPMTVTDLIDATGVTRTAVTEQLHDLEAAGFIVRKLEKLEGRGRPRHIYQATDAALVALFANKQRMLAPAIWRAINEIGGPAMVQKVVRRVSHSMARHYSSRITAKEPKHRLKQLIQLMEREGAMLEMSRENGQLVVLKRSCSFLTMLDENRSVCAIDLEMMSAIVGRRVRRIACRLDGAACCKFALDAE